MWAVRATGPNDKFRAIPLGSRNGVRETGASECGADVCGATECDGGERDGDERDGGVAAAGQRQ